MANEKTDIAVIGGGPAGYCAAIRTAQLGARVTLIEKDTLGGTCLNRGCIPTKVMLQSAEVLSLVRNAGTFGVSAEKVSFHFAMVTERKETVVRRLVSGLTSLMEKNRIKIIKGTAILIDHKTVAIVDTDEKLRSDSIIIATGSKPLGITIEGADELDILDSDKFLAMKQVPKSVVVIGGGVIGLEFAQILHKMGAKVTIVEMMTQILPTEDTEITSFLEDVLKRDGIEIFTGSTVEQLANTGRGDKLVSFNTSKGNQQKTAQQIVVAIGRSPYTNNLGIEKLGISLDKGRIVVNERMETNIPGVYAVGDVTGQMMLAHVAMKEGACAAENALGSECRMDYVAVPRCIYTTPQVAAVGLTEEEARRKHENVRVGKFPFSGNGRAMTLGQTEGLVKIIGEAKYGQILGVHIIGPQATELIAEAVLAMKLEATYRDLANTVFAHPSLSEIMSEAALDIDKCAIHI